MSFKLPVLDGNGQIKGDEALIRQIGAVHLDSHAWGSLAERLCEVARAIHSLDSGSLSHFSMVARGGCQGYYPSSERERDLGSTGNVTLSERVENFEEGVPVGRSYETFDIGLGGIATATVGAPRLFQGGLEFPQIGTVSGTVADLLVQRRALAEVVTNLIEKVGGVPASKLLAWDGIGCSQLRLLHYPSGHNSGLNGHTDYEVFTLNGESAQGLELLVDGNWVPVDGASGPVVLFGDLVEVASNGRVAAARHRVEVDQPRYAFAYFQGLDYFQQVRPSGRAGAYRREGIPSTGVVSGEHLARMTIRNFRHLLERVQQGKLPIDFSIPGANPFDSPSVPLYEPALLPVW